MQLYEGTSTLLYIFFWCVLPPIFILHEFHYILPTYWFLKSYTILKSMLHWLSQLVKSGSNCRSTHYLAKSQRSEGSKILTSDIKCMNACSFTIETLRPWPKTLRPFVKIVYMTLNNIKWCSILWVNSQTIPWTKFHHPPYSARGPNPKLNKNARAMVGRMKILESSGIHTASCNDNSEVCST